jgi:exodeoxyribonuclease VII small subunit
MSSKSQLTYESALKELQQIVSELQEEAIGMDLLAVKVKRAGVLIQFCREKLRDTEKEIEGLISGE